MGGCIHRQTRTSPDKKHDANPEPGFKKNKPDCAPTGSGSRQDLYSVQSARTRLTTIYSFAGAQVNPTTYMLTKHPPPKKKKKKTQTRDPASLHRHNKSPQFYPTSQKLRPKGRRAGGGLRAAGIAIRIGFCLGSTLLFRRRENGVLGGSIGL